MKSYFFILLFGFLLLNAISFSQSAYSITGYWLTSEGESQIEIYQGNDDKFHGRIVWLEEPYEDDGTIKRDKENPDESLRDRKIKGLQILKNFEFDPDHNRWEDGKIYDPESGKTYKCNIWFEDGNTNVLYVKGYIGISLIGRETTWTRENEKRSH